MLYINKHNCIRQNNEGTKVGIIEEIMESDILKSAPKPKEKERKITPPKVDLSKSTLTEEQKTKAEELLNEYNDIFSEELKDPGALK